MQNQAQFNQCIQEGEHIKAVKILEQNGLIHLRETRSRNNFTSDVLLSARVKHLGDNLYGVGICYNSYYYMLHQSLWEQHPDNGVHDRFDGEVMLVDLEKGVLKSQKIDSSKKQINWDSLEWRLNELNYQHYLTSFQERAAKEKRDEEKIKEDLLVKFGGEYISGFYPEVNGIQFIPLTKDDKYACFGAYMTIPYMDNDLAPGLDYVNRHLIAVVGLCEGNKILKTKQWDQNAFHFFVTDRDGIQTDFKREFIGSPTVEVSGDICRMTPRILEKPTFFADMADKMRGEREMSEQIGFTVPESIRDPQTPEKVKGTEGKTSETSPKQEEATKVNTSARVREYLTKQLNATEVSDVIGVKLENGYTAFGTYAKRDGKVSCMTVYCRDNEVLATDSAIIAKGTCPRLDGISVNYSDGFPSVIKIDSAAGSRTFSVPGKIIDGMKTGNHPAPITEQKAVPATPQEASKPKQVTLEQVQNYLLEQKGVSEMSEFIPVNIGKNSSHVAFGGYTKKGGKVSCTVVYCKGGEIIDTTNVGISAKNCPNPNGVAVWRNPPMVEVSYQGAISDYMTRMFLYGMMSREEALRNATVTTKIPIPRKVRKSLEQEANPQQNTSFWARLFRWGGNGGNG